MSKFIRWWYAIYGKRGIQSLVQQHASSHLRPRLSRGRCALHSPFAVRFVRDFVRRRRARHVAGANDIISTMRLNGQNRRHGVR